jgi:DNA-binding NarL/FixJ family response regulator
MVNDKIRLLIADDHKVVLDGLAALLQAEETFSIDATAHDGRQVLDLIRSHDYDIVLLDISMPDMDGIEAARIIKEEKPGLKIIVLTTYREKAIITRLLTLGVDGYLLKNSTRQELVDAILKVAGNGRYFSDEVQSSIIDDYLEPAEGARRKGFTSSATLTPREREILEFLSKGYTNEKIAATLNISFRTVETHRKNMMHKTGANNLAGLLRYAYTNALLK